MKEKAESGTRKLLQIQMSEEFERKGKDFIEDLGKDIGAKSVPMSSMVRECFERERQEWLKHPYVCLNSRHLLYVNENLDYNYFLSEKLQTNMYLEKISMKIPMKEERIKYYLEKYGEKKDTSKELREVWKKNRFWLSMDGMEKVMEEKEDKEGLTSKGVYFSKNFHANIKLVREGFVSLEGYGNWGEEEKIWDYSNFSIDIPTRNIEILVILDLKMYDKKIFGEDFRPDITFGVTNREGYSFSPENLMDLLKIENSVYEKFIHVSSIFSEEREGKALKKGDQRYLMFLKTLKWCLNRLEGKGVSFDVPKSFSFFYFKVPMLPDTLNISVKWPYSKKGF